MKKDFLDSLSVKSPCHESWEEMSGGDQIRFCSHCAKDVHDLSAMTRAQAEKLVKNSNGNLCVRYVKTPQGRLITAPPKFTQITRHAGIAAIVLAATLALSAFAYSQEENQTPKQKYWTQTVKKISKTGEEKNNFSTISGTVTDTNDAVVPGAKVTLRNVNNQEILYAQTDDIGIYEFAGVEPGVYEIEIESPGFKKLLIEDITVAGNESFEQTAVLEVSEMIMTGLPVIDADPVEPGETEINQTVQHQELLELPKGRLFTTMGLIAIAPSEEKPKPEKSKKAKKKKN